MTRRRYCVAVVYAALSTGDRAANLQKAINAFKATLRVRTEGGFLVQWAAMQANLGNAYAALPSGDRASNLQKAIAVYQPAQGVYIAQGVASDSPPVIRSTPFSAQSISKKLYPKRQT